MVKQLVPGDFAMSVPPTISTIMAEAGLLISP